MTTKKILAILSILFGCVVVLLVVGGIFFYRSVIAPYLAMKELPPELREAKIITGTDFLTKTEFYQAGKGNSLSDLRDPEKIKSRFDSIADIAIGQLDGQPDLDIGLVGRYSTTLLDKQGNVKEQINYQFEKGTVGLGPFGVERVKDDFDEVQLLDIEGDGVCEILGSGGLDGAILFNHRGQVLFSLGAREEGKSSIMEMDAGDIDGDGMPEFVATWGYEPWNGIELFDRNGNSKWRHEEEFILKQLKIVDVNGDGKAEFVEENGDELKIRDAQGKVTSKAQMPVYLWHISLCPRPDGKGTPQTLAVRDGSLWLVDLDGKNFSKFDAPLSHIKLEKPREINIPGMSEPLVTDTEEVYRAEGVWVKLKKDQPKYLAVIARFSVLDRSLFYVYDERGKLVYHEIMPEECKAAAVLSKENDGGSEDVLVSGEKTVWRYAAR